MPKKPKNREGEPWTKEEDDKLKFLAREKRNMPAGLIAYKLGRTVHAVRNRAYRKGISLKPVNRSPYHRRKK